MSPNHECAFATHSELRKPQTRYSHLYRVQKQIARFQMIGSSI
jgi:hypothetical protein